MAIPVTLIRAKFLALKPVMDERLARLWAGAEAEAIGAGGITLVAAATGMSRTTIRAGRDELRKGVAACDVVRVRRAGAGRPAIEKRLIQARATAEQQGWTEMAKLLAGVEKKPAAEIAKTVIAALDWLQRQPELRAFAVQIEMVALNLKNLK